MDVTADSGLNESELAGALDREEFALYYQPNFDPRTEEVSGLEAFLRWNHPRQGLRDAGSFIAGVEHNPLLAQRVDQWVLNTAMREGRRFLEDGHVLKTLSINLSTWLGGDELVAMVAAALKSSGLQASYLSLECPWRMFAAHSAAILPTMRKLDGLGCSLVMDGSPLEQECLDILQGSPVRMAKVCYEALSGKLDEAGMDAAARLIKGLQGMGVKVVVVGIENEEHAELARQAGCYLSQGYRFKSPLSANHVRQLLAVIRRTRDAFSLL